MTHRKRSHRSRPPPGGPAALAGFLYQLLGSAEWVVLARFQARGPGAAPVLILEPSSGGDARHDCEVVQYKRRGRAWTVTSLVREVFPDLYRALADGAVERTSLQTDAPYQDLSGRMEPAALQLDAGVAS